MKKTILFLAAAAVALVACNKTESVGSDEGQPLSFRVAVDNITKANYYWTDHHDGTLGIAYMASSYTEDGTVIDKYIPSNSSAAYNFLTSGDNGSTWKFANTEYFFPLGGSTFVDVLALADYNYLAGQEYNGPYDVNLKKFHDGDAPAASSTTDTGWEPYFSATNPAQKVSFTVNTYAAHVTGPSDNRGQTDLMYAVANRINKKNPQGKLVFKHAQAALIFNIKIANHVPDFINLHNILFVDFASNGYNYLGLTGKGSDLSINSSPIPVDKVSLKTIGTFTVDNSLNREVAEWSDLYANNNQVSPHFIMDEYNNYRTALTAEEKNFNGNLMDEYHFLNPGSTDSYIHWSKEFKYLVVAGSYNDPWNGGDFSADLFSRNSNPFNADEFYQFGSPLLIPEQPTSNFWLYYSIGENNYLTEVNIPRGVWKMGHRYRYDLTLNFAGPTLTVEVKPYVSSDSAPYVFAADI